MYSETWELDFINKMCLKDLLKLSAKRKKIKFSPGQNCRLNPHRAKLESQFETLQFTFLKCNPNLMMPLATNSGYLHNDRSTRSLSVFYTYTLCQDSLKLYTVKRFPHMDGRTRLRQMSVAHCFDTI